MEPPLFHLPGPKMLGWFSTLSFLPAAAKPEIILALLKKCNAEQVYGGGRRYEEDKR